MILWPHQVTVTSLTAVYICPESDPIYDDVSDGIILGHAGPL